MFGKFMNKKFFHPGSYPNVKMRWIHEQRDTAKKKLEEEKQSTYQKEQESYQSRMLSAKSTEEKMKLDLNFLYDLPPGMKVEGKDKDGDKEKEEEEVKFEWRKHAPRSKYVNDLGLDCQDQPFGICVRNIRCFKCKVWGHQNTDRECPLFFSNVNSEAEGNAEGKRNLRLSDPLLLVDAMKEQHGISLKKSVIGQEIDPMADNQQFLPSDDDDDELGNPDLEFVESLTGKQKRRLLKRLNKLEKNEHKESKKKKRHKSHVEMENNRNMSSSEDESRNYEKEKDSRRNAYGSDTSSYKKWENKYDYNFDGSRSNQKRICTSNNDKSDNIMYSKTCGLRSSIGQSDCGSNRYKKDSRNYSKKYKYSDDNEGRRNCSESFHTSDNKSTSIQTHRQHNIYTSNSRQDKSTKKRQTFNNCPDNSNKKPRDLSPEESSKRCHRKETRQYQTKSDLIKRSQRYSSESSDEVDEKLHQIRKGLYKR